MILNGGDSNNLAGIQDPVGGITKRARPDDILAVLHS